MDRRYGPQATSVEACANPLYGQRRLFSGVALHNFVVISGCSGGGKSTLLKVLRERGHTVVDEPGRRIIAQERQGDGLALPWVDGAAFARRAIEMSLADRAQADGAAGWVFFDRGLIDAAAALEHLTGEPAVDTLCRTHRYNPLVFLTPPWPEIYTNDQERRHGLAEAVAEYDRLSRIYPSLGYEVYVLPKISPEERADHLLAALGSTA